MGKYIEILVFMVAGAFFPILNVFMSWLLRRSYPDPKKKMAYESGEIPFGDARVKFHISYYVFALVFLIFDVESLFLYPWAAMFRQLQPGLALGEMTAFIVMLGVGLIYAWKKRALTWV